MRRVFLALVTGSMLSFGASTSHALGIGRTVNTTVLGQTLDFTAVITGTADETGAVGCVTADVFSGDNQLNPALVRIRLEPGPDPQQLTARVMTTVRIDEPVVAVNLSVGCPTRVSRRFVAFVDPPTVTLPQAAEEPASASTARAEVVPPVTATRGRATPVGGERRARSTAKASSRVAARRPRRPIDRASAANPSQVVARATGSKTAQLAAAPARPALTASAATPVPRLVLDPSPMLIAAATAVPDRAASAAVDAERSAQATELARERERVKAMEDSVERLRRENQATQQTLAAMQLRLREADSASRPTGVLVALFALLGLLALALAVLWSRHAKLKREAEWWGHAAQPADAQAPPAVIAELELEREAEPVAVAPTPVVVVMPPPIPEAFPVPRMPEVAPTTDDADPPIVEPLVARLLPSEVTQAPRELSVEELIDLEQQADFFAVLGQDEEAIDLLMGLVRSSGGTSPTPYLKLLEIYRRRGERAPYERIRERFNQRFNGDAPSFDIDIAKGRALVDYPDVMKQLQAAWSIPQQASAVINGLLFKRAMPVDPFDLLAYGDLLFVQRIVRDLVDVESGLQGVDLLLPFDMLEDPLSLDLDLDRSHTKT